jgi:hypothetical protein
MNGHKQIHRDQQGSIILVVLGFLFLTIGLVITIMGVGSNARKVSQEQLNMEQAMFVAEGGLERGARFMESNLAVIVGSATGITNGSGTINSGTYTFYIARSNSASSMYMIVSTGTVNNTVSSGTITRVCSLLNVYQPTYAEFALWSSNNNALSFVVGEVFKGHVHAVTELYFNNAGGGPVFHSALTSEFGTYSGSISGIEFDQGLILNSHQGSMVDIDFKSASSQSLKNRALANGLYLSGNTTITFNGGTVSISNTHTNPVWASHSYTLPAKGIIYVANSGTTSGANAGIIYITGGTVGAPVTLVSENDMHIAGNITYVHNPITDSTSTDALGLISQDSIQIDTTAPNNIQIQAAMIAAGTSGDGDVGSFGVINYNTGSARGSINLLGGIVQLTRGAVGTVNGSGTLQTGYNKSYSYDTRFLTTPPPFYPTISNKVSFAQWTEGH